jgi:hypothetical protein
MDTLHIVVIASRCAARRRGDLEALLRLSFWRSLHTLRTPVACAGSIRLQASRPDGDRPTDVCNGVAAARRRAARRRGRGLVAQRCGSAATLNGSAAVRHSKTLGTAARRSTVQRRHGGTAARRQRATWRQDDTAVQCDTARTARRRGCGSAARWHGRSLAQ